MHVVEYLAPGGVVAGGNAPTARVGVPAGGVRAGGVAPGEPVFLVIAVGSTVLAQPVEEVVQSNGVINEVIPEGGDRNTITYHEFRGPFTVTVVAVDLAGNASAPSNAITVSTQGGGCF